ncbi:MAG: hypothetical protein ACR2IV_16350 [Bryobacteraceae bacterium]
MLRFAALVILFLVNLLAAAEVPSKLLGRWRSLETSPGGIGALLEFHADGSVDFSPGAVVESPYRIEVNQLILPSESNHGPEQKMAIEFVGENKLRLKPSGNSTAPGNTAELVRKGIRSDPLSLIIGEWRGTRDIGGHQAEMRWLFYSTGKSLLLIPFRTDHGRFTVEGAKIHFDLPGAMLAEGHFDINGDVLSLPGRKTASRYARY